jgi:hypothetical protein
VVNRAATATSARPFATWPSQPCRRIELTQCRRHPRSSTPAADHQSRGRAHLDGEQLQVHPRLDKGRAGGGRAHPGPLVHGLPAPLRPRRRHARVG